MGIGPLIIGVVRRVLDVGIWPVGTDFLKRIGSAQLILENHVYAEEGSLKTRKDTGIGIWKTKKYVF
jgi:hypothetical protein